MATPPGLHLPPPTPLRQENFRNEIFWTSGRLIRAEDRIADPPGLYPGSSPEANLVESAVVYASPSAFVEAELERRREEGGGGGVGPDGRRRNSSSSAAELHFVSDMRNWIWYSTGKPIGLGNWVLGNPRPDPNATCVELNTQTYQWASFNCQAKFRFVCEVNYDA